MSNRHRPRGLSDAQWAALAPVHADIWETYAERTKRAVLSDPGAPNTLARYLSWAIVTMGYPGDATVMQRALISYYIEHQLPGLSDRTRATYRSQLTSISDVVVPAHLGPPQHEFIPRKPSVEPYSPAEVALLRQWANTQPTSIGRRNANVVLALGLGAGFNSREINRLRVRNVLVDADGVVVQSAKDGRLVPVRAEWERVLVDAIDQLPRDAFVFRPGRIESRRALANATSGFVTRSTSAHLAPNPYRLRVTWIVEHLRDRVPADILARACGAMGGESLTKYLKYVSPADAAHARALLRGPGSATATDGGVS